VGHALISNAATVFDSVPIDVASAFDIRGRVFAEKSALVLTGTRAIGTPTKCWRPRRDRAGSACRSHAVAVGVARRPLESFMG